MYHIIVKKLDKIVVWDSVTIKNRPSQYNTDVDFIKDIFRSGYLSLFGFKGSKRDKDKTFNLIVVDDEKETIIDEDTLSSTGVDCYYYLLSTLEFMEFIYVKSLSSKEIYKRFVYDDTKRMLNNQHDSKSYFNTYIEPIINRSFNQSGDKLVTCLDMNEFEFYFHRIEKIYLRLTPKDKRKLDQYKLYAILFASKNRYLNTIDIKEVMPKFN